MKLRSAVLFGVLAVGLVSPVAAVEPATFEAAVKHLLDTSTCRTVGWSKDGKVCVLQALDGGARGATGVQFRILDAVEDEQVAEVTLWSDEFDIPEEDLASAILGSEAFSDFLIEYDAQKLVFSELALAPFPLAAKAGTFTARAEVKVVEADQEYSSQILDYRVVVNAKGVGNKTVTSGRVENAYEVTVRGHVLSPFEPRALVIYQVTQAGFEGDRNVTLRFAGCKLNSGFK